MESEMELKIQVLKELLSEVLGYKVDYIASVGETYIGLHTEMGGKNINIYELAHKCKEWALAKGYIINSGATTNNDWCSTIYKVIQENPYIEELSHTWGQLEVEAIIQACEWILKEIKCQ